MVEYARALLGGSADDQRGEGPHSDASREEQSSASGCTKDGTGEPATSASEGAQHNDKTAEAGKQRLPEKRVSNSKLKQELGVVLRYSSYREGLRAIHTGELAPFD